MRFFSSGTGHLSRGGDNAPSSQALGNSNPRGDRLLQQARWRQSPQIGTVIKTIRIHPSPSFAAAGVDRPYRYNIAHNGFPLSWG